MIDLREDGDQERVDDDERQGELWIDVEEQQHDAADRQDVLHGVHDRMGGRPLEDVYVGAESSQDIARPLPPEEEGGEPLHVLEDLLPEIEEYPEP